MNKVLGLTAVMMLVVISVAGAVGCPAGTVACGGRDGILPPICCSQGPQGEKGETGDQGNQGFTGNDASCEKRGMPYGAGIDVVVWESGNKNVGVETQYRYDVNNEEHAAYLVGKVNLWEMVNKK